MVLSVPAVGLDAGFKLPARAMLYSHTTIPTLINIIAESLKIVFNFLRFDFIAY